MSARASEPTRRPPGAPRILLVRLSAIGDCLHALPVIHELRRQIPDAFLGWAIEAPGLSLLEGHPEVDRFHLYPRARADGGRWRALLGFRRELRAIGYDVAIDVQGLTKSGLVAWLSGAAERIGFGDRDSRELNRLFLNRRLVPSAQRVHVIDRNLALLDALGLEVPARASWTLPSYQPSPELAAFLREVGGARFVTLNPGAAWPSKRWPVPAFARLARRIALELDAPVAITWGTPEEREDAEAIRDAAAVATVRVAPPTDLRQLAALLARASLMVSGDTGPLHLAAALETRCVGIFGPTAPARNGPYDARLGSRLGARHGGPHAGRHLTVSDDSPLECRPCWRTTCGRGDLACLERVEPDAVFAACARAWEAIEEAV